jgi:hypothetical protein
MSLPSARPAVSRGHLLAAVAVGLVVGYVAAVGPVVTTPEQVLYPTLWLGVSIATLWRLRAQVAGLGARSLTVALAYTVVLLWVAGLLGPATGPAGLRIHLGIPGWGPAVAYTGTGVTVVLVPFLLVGYATLGLLAAVAIRHTVRAGAAGLLGLFACVSCTAPLLAGLAGVLGAGSLAATLTGAGYPVGTAAFVLSVGAFVVLVPADPDR